MNLRNFLSALVQILAVPDIALQDPLKCVLCSARTRKGKSLGL